jgi:crotonobetainyl-CoA:carnitine CoA-transferase CaiB-like acyl-CoA transferase
MANAEELDNLVEDWTVSRTAAEVMTLLQQAGVAAGVVQVADDIAHDPQLEARQFYWTAEHPTMGMTHFDGQPMKLSRTPCVTPRASRLLGQDNDYVYGDLLGMSKEDIAKYTEQRIFA